MGSYLFYTRVLHRFLYRLYINTFIQLVFIFSHIILNSNLKLFVLCLIYEIAITNVASFGIRTMIYIMINNKSFKNLSIR